MFNAVLVLNTTMFTQIYDDKISPNSLSGKQGETPCNCAQSATCSVKLFDLQGEFTDSI
jgi:hypothetical protein